MYNIFIYNPLYKDSNYIPHLIEHTILCSFNNINQFFNNYDIKWESYTYYTNYIIKSNTIWEKEIINLLLWWINKECLKYERKILKEELANMTYSLDITNIVWELFYNKKLKYSKICKSSFEEIEQYYNKYYQRDNIILLPTDRKLNDIKIDDFIIWKIIDFNHKHEKLVAYTFDYSIQNLFIIEYIVDAFDFYLNYFQRHTQWKYFLNEIIYWEYDDFIFFCYSKESQEILNTISKEFVEQYIKYKLLNFNKQNFDYMDWPLIMKFGYSLSKKSKYSIIENIEKYINIFLNEINSIQKGH